MGSSASQLATSKTLSQTTNEKIIDENKVDGAPLSERNVSNVDCEPGAHVPGEIKTSVVSKKKKSGKAKFRLHPVLQADWKIIGSFLTTVLQSDAQCAEAKAVLERHVYQIQLEKGDFLMKTDSRVDGVYFVKAGELHIISESEEDTALYALTPGQWCGDVGVLYKGPAALTVTANTSSTLLFIPARRLRSVLSGFRKPREEYCAQGFNIPAVSGGTKEIWREKLLLAVLAKIPLFEGWSVSQLVRLVNLFPAYPVMIYPPGSLVVVEGDSVQRALVLVKGSLSVFGGETLITTFKAYRHPFLIAEEDLFVERSAPLTLVAAEPCWIIRIQKDWIENVMKGEDDIRQVWEQKQDDWDMLVKRRDPDIFSRFGGLLQVEVIYKWLRECEQFALCPPSCVYDVARLAAPQVTFNGQLTNTVAEYLLLVIPLNPSGAEGESALIDPVSLYSHKHPWVYVEDDTTDVILALWFDMAAVDKVLLRYPGKNVVLDWTPQYKSE